MLKNLFTMMTLDDKSRELRYSVLICTTKPEALNYKMLFLSCLQSDVDLVAIEVSTE